MRSPIDSQQQIIPSDALFYYCRAAAIKPVICHANFFALQSPLIIHFHMDTKAGRNTMPSIYTQTYFHFTHCLFCRKYKQVEMFVGIAKVFFFLQRHVFKFKRECATVSFLAFRIQLGTLAGPLKQITNTCCVTAIRWLGAQVQQFECRRREQPHLPYQFKVVMRHYFNNVV